MTEAETTQLQVLRSAKAGEPIARQFFMNDATRQLYEERRIDIVLHNMDEGTCAHCITPYGEELLDRLAGALF